MDYDTMTWLYCVIEKTLDHYIVSCIVLFAKSMKIEYME